MSSDADDLVAAELAVLEKRRQVFPNAWRLVGGAPFLTQYIF